MAVTLPVDFEKKVKLPPPPNGAGYPYRISAKDLMDNFNALANADALPDGTYGDVLFHDGAKWTALVAPSGADGDVVLTHDGIFPYWAAVATTGGTGALIFNDCDAAEVARIEWVDGLITTNGTQTVEGGCAVASTP